MPLAEVIVFRNLGAIVQLVAVGCDGIAINAAAEAGPVAGCVVKGILNPA